MRRLVLVTGAAAWCEAWVSARLAGLAEGELLWVAGSAPAGITPTPSARVLQLLGSECRLLVFNAHQGFHPDAFVAAVGTLRGGGDCVLLAPPPAGWDAFADPDKARFAAYPRGLDEMYGHFLARLAERWAGDPSVRRVYAGGTDGVVLRVAPRPAGGLELSTEQTQALAAVEQVAHGHARRPLVLSADRGRGKSTLLGVAAARLLRGGLARVTVVAPHRAAAATLFRQAQLAAGLAAHGVADTPIGDGLLCFRLPAECLADDAAPGLVLVDEAAAIPVAVLQRLLVRSKRLVFATTLQGYEGSGRGFELRFQAILDRQMPQWRAMTLSTPVRWADHDPLEALLNASFLLDAGLVDAAAARGGLSITRVGPAALCADEDLLRAAFGLLINAHYQTRPSDLRQLLDNPDNRLWLAHRGGVLVGVLLASLEGALDQATAGQVVAGERRPRGHLLPQSLAVHAGLEACLQQRVLRVQRIAVHPLTRRQGIGGRLLQTLIGWGRDQGLDLLGCAFAADPALLGFWRTAGFAPVRLGVRLDPASASHSLFMLHGLSAAGKALAEDGARRFLTDLPWTLAGLDELDSRLAGLLLQGRDCGDLVLDSEDRRALTRIAAGARQPATAAALVWRTLVRIAAHGAAPPEDLAPLIAHWLQHQAAPRLCRTFGVCGRRALDERLRAVLRMPSNTPATRG